MGRLKPWEAIDSMEKEEEQASRVVEGQPQAGPPAGSTAAGNEPAPWVQVQAGHELAHLVSLARFTPGQVSAYLHSQHDAEALIWRWALKWAKDIATTQEQPRVPVPGPSAGPLEQWARDVGSVTQHDALVQQRDELLAALKKVRLRIAFIGMPQERRRPDGCVDWVDELRAINAAIQHAEVTHG